MILCSRCPAPAFLRVDDHTVMCAACWTLTIARVTEQMKADFENTDPVAKATKGKAGTAGVNDPVRRSTAGTGLRVGEDDAVRPATSEIMDATAGETAPNSFAPLPNPPGVKPVTDGSLSPLDRSPAAFDDGIPEQFRRARVA